MSRGSSRLVQAIFHQLGLSSFIRDHTDKQLRRYDLKQRKLIAQKERQSDKSLDKIRTSISDHKKRVKALERHLELNVKHIKRLTKLLNATSRTIRTHQQEMHLLVRTRQHDQLADAVNRLEALYPLPLIAAHIKQSVANSRLSTEPCPHVVIDRILPDDLYAALYNDMPPPEFWRKGTPGRDNWTIGEDIAPVSSEALWSFMNDRVASESITPTLVNKFHDYCQSLNSNRINPKLARPPHIDYKLSDGRLMLRRPGYSLEPHVDPRRSILTALMYMGTSDGSENHGTKLFTSNQDIPLKYSGIYYPLREGAQCTVIKHVPCRPNSMLVFASRLGIHGADIPSNTQPSTLKRHSYHFFVGINKNNDGTSEDVARS
jgi:hypothetical protein